MEKNPWIFSVQMAGEGSKNDTPKKDYFRRQYQTKNHGDHMGVVK